MPHRHRGSLAPAGWQPETRNTGGSFLSSSSGPAPDPPALCPACPLLLRTEHCSAVSYGSSTCGRRSGNGHSAWPVAAASALAAGGFLMHGCHLGPGGGVGGPPLSLCREHSRAGGMRSGGPKGMMVVIGSLQSGRPQGLREGRLPHGFRWLGRRARGGNVSPRDRSARSKEHDH